MGFGWFRGFFLCLSRGWIKLDIVLPLGVSVTFSVSFLLFLDY
jgi:hypothetical protein